MTEIIQDNNHLIQDNNHLIIVTEIIIIIIDKDTTVKIQIETIETITIDNVLIVTIEIIPNNNSRDNRGYSSNENKITDIIQKNGEMMETTIAKTE